MVDSDCPYLFFSTRKRGLKVESIQWIQCVKVTNRQSDVLECPEQNSSRHLRQGWMLKCLLFSLCKTIFKRIFNRIFHANAWGGRFVSTLTVATPFLLTLWNSGCVSTFPCWNLSFIIRLRQRGRVWAPRQLSFSLWTERTWSFVPVAHSRTYWEDTQLTRRTGLVLLLHYGSWRSVSLSLSAGESNQNQIKAQAVCSVGFLLSLRASSCRFTSARSPRPQHVH